MLRGIFLAISLMSLTNAVNASSSQFHLAAQQDWSKNQGFYLSLESKSDKGSCSVDDLKLVLAVADGKDWRYLMTAPKWKFGKVYNVRCIIDNSSIEFWLDGSLTEKSEWRFMPKQDLLTVNHIPLWNNGQTDYIVLQMSQKIEGGSIPLSLSFKEEASRPVQLLLFNPQAPRHLKWQPIAGKRLVLESEFRLLRKPELSRYAPFVDRYGQCRYAEWPAKIRSDEELRSSIQDEERILSKWREPKGYDRYGGCTTAGWREKATGFFKISRRNGWWWLISPEGNPCFYTGICTAPSVAWDMTPVTGRESYFEGLPPKDGDTKQLWNRDVWGSADGEYVPIHSMNLMRRYGSDWKKRAEEVTARRTRVWGFSGLGKWSFQDGISYFPYLNRKGVPVVSRHPDIFDPVIKEKFREAIRNQVEPKKNDPFIVGWSLGNEYDEIITKGEIEEILKKPADVPVKRALVDHALEAIFAKDTAKMAASWKVQAADTDSLYASQPIVPDSDIEALRQFYAKSYYSFIYETVKKLDPNHIYFGFWIVPGWWENEADWRVSTPYCDVIGFDYYAYEFPGDMLDRLIRESNKPVLYGEFSFPPFYQGTRGYGVYSVFADDEKDAGQRYRKRIEETASNPYCIGALWFQYRDEPVTGRGPGSGSDLVYGENFAFGVVDVTDRPKWPLVEQMRKANLASVQLRAKAMTQKEGAK